LRENAGNTDLQQIAGLFGCMRGQYDTFLFKDQDPAFSVANSQGFGVGDGSTTVFRFARSYGAQFAEPVAAVAVGASVTADGVPAVGMSVNSNAGTVTFTAAPAAGVLLAWTGTYYWRCRFDTDELTTEQFLSQLWQGSVTFITCKV
jgi:uncharacterized protein (TIGR02217 family)